MRIKKYDSYNRRPKYRSTRSDPDYNPIESESEDEYFESGSIRSNHVFLNGDINRDSISDLISQIERVEWFLHKLEFKVGLKGSIILHINSYGGDVHEAFRAVDTIQQCKYPITSIIEGFCGSAATFIALAARQRQIGRYAYLLIHQLSTCHQGKYQDLRDGYRNCRDIQQRVNHLYIEKTKMTSKQVEKLIGKERELDAQRALELGFVDQII